MKTIFISALFLASFILGLFSGFHNVPAIGSMALGIAMLLSALTLMFAYEEDHQ